MEVLKDDGFSVMAEVLPRNEKTEKIIAERIKKEKLREEQLQKVSVSVRLFWILR